MDATAVENAKRAAGEEAARLVEPGMALGLGTGSTAYWFIAAVGERVAAGLQVRAVATSHASEEQARALGIAIVELDEDGLDLAVDGADAVDPQLRLIKGAGAALLREKVVAAAARRFIVVVDESKLRDRLGGVVPVEVVRFGVASTLRLLRETGTGFVLRRDPRGQPVVTDNGNWVADGAFAVIPDPEGLAAQLEAIPGVVGHGLFLGMADLVIVARGDGSISRLAL